MNATSSTAGTALEAEVRVVLGRRARATQRFQQLVSIIDGLDSCVLALSGGIDSSFLAIVAARLLGPRCMVVTADSPAFPAWDREDAKAVASEARRFGATWRLISTHELDDERYATNPRSRCFFCKQEVYGALARIARDNGCAWVVDGTNATDLVATDRPGISAASGLGVRSPLAEAGITKDDVRRLARALGLPDWDRPASACLSSRIPYGVRITPERLRRVETAESSLRGLGFKVVRVRDHGDAARVEVRAADVERLRAAAAHVGNAILAAGFGSWTPAVYVGAGAGDAREVPGS
jgi:uncharacterized protein